MRTMKDTVTLYQVHHNYKMETKVAADDKHFFLSVSARRRLRRSLAPVSSLLLFRALIHFTVHFGEFNLSPKINIFYAET